MQHPECSGAMAIEPSVGELLRLRQFKEQIDKLGAQECRAICHQLADLALMTYPATLRWLAREAARGIKDQEEGARMVEQLVAVLTEKGGLNCPPSET